MQLQEETILNFAVREGASLPSIHYQARKPGNKAELFLLYTMCTLLWLAELCRSSCYYQVVSHQLGITPGAGNTDLIHAGAFQGAFRLHSLLPSPETVTSDFTAAVEEHWEVTKIQMYQPTEVAL